MVNKNSLNEELYRIHEMMGLTENQLDMFADAEDDTSDDSIEVSDDELIGKKVMVYYNLHKHVFSVTYKGLVKSYSDYVKLKDVEFRVRQGGKEKVRDEKRKNVHAFVIGTLVDYKEHPSDDIPQSTGSKVITYNPYKYDSFVYKNDETPVYMAKEVEMINQPSDKIFQINELEAKAISEEYVMEDSNLRGYISKLKSKLGIIKDNLKQEGVETLEAIAKLIKAASGTQKLSDEDLKEIGVQLKDLLKLSGLAAISILPGGLIAAILIKFFKKESWITPSSFKDNPVSISEASVVGYSDDKIDEFIVDATRVRDEAISSIGKYKNIVLNSTLMDIYDNKGTFNKYHDDMRYEYSKTYKKFQYYYDVVDAFDFRNLSDKLKVLESIVEELDDLHYTLDELSEVLEDLMYKTNSLENFHGFKGLFKN